MVFKNITVIKEWRVNNMTDFINQFHLVGQIKKDYKIKDLQELYTQGECDEDLIYHYLKKDKRKFLITEMPDDNIGCYWIIQEVL